MHILSVWKRIRDWWVDQELQDHFDRALARLDHEIEENQKFNRTNQQLMFLLSQAPMQNAPTEVMQARKAVTRYAYISPKAFMKLGFNSLPFKANETGKVVLNSSFENSTTWIITPLMPEYGVIYGPNLMPGINL